ncbi:MAG: CIA30 family protein [Bacteroidota bacterium]
MKIALFVLTAIILTIVPVDTNFDFGSKKDGIDWKPIDDGVMGGLSKGNVNLTENTLNFYGEVSLDNYGGFTSVKSPFGNYNLSGLKKVIVRYRTEGQSISISLENSEQFFRPYYKLLLPETDGEWKTLELNVSDFKQYNLGQVTETSITDEFLENVKRIGFITSKKSAGKFNIEVDYLNFK